MFKSHTSFSGHISIPKWCNEGMFDSQYALRFTTKWPGPKCDVGGKDMPVCGVLFVDTEFVDGGAIGPEGLETGDVGGVEGVVT
jgi:hypothetical protein